MAACSAAYLVASWVEGKAVMRVAWRAQKWAE